MNLWETILIQPLVNALLLCYQISFNNLGIAIILITVAIKLVLVPIVVPSMRSMQKMKDLAPELEKLKKRHKDDKTKLMQAQADLYKAHNINPAAGCLPQIVQLIILIALFRVFVNVLPADSNSVEAVNHYAYSSLKITEPLNTNFLYLNLVKPDVFPVEGFPFPLPGPFLLIAAVLQFLGAKMMMPFVEEEKKVAEKTPQAADDIAVAMQKQSLYMFPLLTIVAGVSFASGLVLYWTASSLAQAVQQYFISGWGGLTPWMKKAKLIS
jgi:YidC/Oxa1 family membrane protein insertase